MHVPNMAPRPCATAWPLLGELQWLNTIGNEIRYRERLGTSRQGRTAQINFAQYRSSRIGQSAPGPLCLQEEEENVAA